MRYEFSVELRRIKPNIPEPPKPRVPPIRRTLILAYQIADYMKARGIISLNHFCRQAQITSARGSQIMSLLNLSPAIQEQILTDDNAVKDFAERQLRHIFQESLWKKQEVLWRTLVSCRALGLDDGKAPRNSRRPRDAGNPAPQGLAQASRGPR